MTFPHLPITFETPLLCVASYRRSKSIFLVHGCSSLQSGTVGSKNVISLQLIVGPKARGKTDYF